MKPAAAFLIATLLSASAQTRYGTVFLNNYDSGKGLFSFACGIPAPVGTMVDVLGGQSPAALSPIASTFPGDPARYTIQQDDLDVFGPGTGSFFDRGFGEVPFVLPGATAYLVLRMWYFGPSYDSASLRSSVAWSQPTGTNPEPPELPRPAILQIPRPLKFVAIGPLGTEVTVLPLSQAVRAGQSATFIASTTIAGPLIYQWWKEGVNLNGATNATLTLTNISRADAGAYGVTIASFWCEGGRSSNATLRVFAPQRFEAPTVLADGRLRLLFRDHDGNVAPYAYATNYFTMQASTNLVDWQAASGSVSLTNGFLLFEENTPLAVASRFYRILER